VPRRHTALLLALMFVFLARPIVGESVMRFSPHRLVALQTGAVSAQGTTKKDESG
jgi:hypothetical protein